MTYDNIFTSPKLFWNLMLKGIGVADTTKTVGRDHWPQMLNLTKEGPERGDILWKMHASNLLVAVTWYDNKPSSLLSMVFSLIDVNNDVFVKTWQKIVERSIFSKTKSGGIIILCTSWTPHV